MYNTKLSYSQLLKIFQMLNYHISMLCDCFIKVYLLCVLTMVIVLLEYISIGVNIGTNHLRHLQHFSREYSGGGGK